jgi:peptide chain release factor 3
VPDPTSSPSQEASRRRTFAIISHPDAGKTTLTEKFLLYGGAVQDAGQVKARGERRRVRSDWMDMEQQRGISITSTVLQFPYRDRVLNLLDTPGHRDFSEDTYRVLAAADSAIMVLDAASGIEAQTLKLFEVCRERRIPLITFVNKWDRPGREALELTDEVESTLDLATMPITWPVGIAGDFRGLIDRRSGSYVRFSRTARGATEAGEEIVGPEDARELDGDRYTTAVEQVELLEAVGSDFDRELFEDAHATPVFFGSALTNFGVRLLLDAVVDIAPSPRPRDTVDGTAREVDDPFSGFVFKVQANMDPSHRDRIAFLRVCSGRFERGEVVTHEPTGKPFATKYAHSVFGQGRETVDEAYPGDVIGLVNATEVRVGDTLYEGSAVRYPEIPAFAPELFAVARPKDIGRFKQFRKGVSQLDEEGVIQVLRDPDLGDQEPVLAAVGQMQFEVVAARLAEEFGSPAELSMTRYSIARLTDEDTAPRLRGMAGVRVLERSDGALLALFESVYWLQRLESDNPDWTLRPLVAEGLAG